MNSYLLRIVAVALVAALGAYYLLAPRPEPAGSGDALVAVAVPQLDAVQQRGEVAFNANCAECHGVNGAGRDGVAPPLVHIIYETSHHGDQAFYLAVANGVRGHHWPFGNMPAIEGVSEDAVSDIIAYVRALQRANGIN